MTTKSKSAAELVQDALDALYVSAAMLEIEAGEHRSRDAEGKAKACGRQAEKNRTVALAAESVHRALGALSAPAATEVHEVLVLAS